MSKTIESPETLVFVIVLARELGARELEKNARQVLEEKFGVKLTFTRPKPNPDANRID